MIEQVKILPAGAIPAVRHQPAGRMCCSCRHLGSDFCRGLDFASMPVLHMYNDGTAAVRCKGHARGESAASKFIRGIDDAHKNAATSSLTFGSPADAPAVVKPALSVRMFSAANGYSDGNTRGILREFAAEVELLEIAARVTTP